MNEDALETSFVDVGTNVLAIMMIVTMFALLTMRTETAVPHDPRFTEEPVFALRTQPTLTERPFHHYYLVLEGGIVRWQQERYVEQLLVEDLGKTIELPQGKLRVSFPDEPRDPDSFTASFFPDFPALAEVAEPLTEETAGEIASGIVERWDDGGWVPNFVVFPSGMEAFATLYAGLREESIWLRWFLQAKDEPIKIERRAKYFDYFSFEF